MTYDRARCVPQELWELELKLINPRLPGALPTSSLSPTRLLAAHHPTRGGPQARKSYISKMAGQR